MTAQLPPSAGVFRRLAALVYDSVVVIGLAFVVTNLYLMVYNALVGLKPHALDSTLLQTTLFPLIVLTTSAFYAWFWTHGGRTLGMRAWHLRLITTSGNPVPWSQALIRLVAAPLSIAPLFLGYFYLWIDKEKRTWHDQLSGTCVILDKSRR